MSLVIRLRKPAKSTKKRYHYKIVVDEKRSKKEGRFIEQIGFWDPSKNPKFLKVDMERFKEWVSKGAQPTDTVKSLVTKAKKAETNPAVLQPVRKKKKLPKAEAKPEPEEKEKPDLAKLPAEEKSAEEKQDKSQENEEKQPENAKKDEAQAAPEKPVEKEKTEAEPEEKPAEKKESSQSKAKKEEDSKDSDDSNQ